MGGSLPHRGALGNIPEFAEKFVAGRMEGFQKDMKICLNPKEAPHRKKPTHAYFPALGSCCATLEYLAGLYLGKVGETIWSDVAEYANHFMKQPDYDKEVIRVLFKAFRRSVAHRGIASGVWVDTGPGTGKGRRITWKIYADAKRPALEVLDEVGTLTFDPPWPCAYTHRVHIHLKGLEMDIRDSAKKYQSCVKAEPDLQTKFETAMRYLYP